MPEKMTVNGVLLLDKPVGISSQHAVQKIKYLFQAKKVGHTGSLDVAASGLLPICLGEATKFSQFLLEADKTYTTTACLGKRTSTLDQEGKVIEEKAWQHITVDDIQQALNQLTGEITQVPPMYSALKHKGQPLYKLARQGLEISRKARKVHIYALQLLDYTDGQVSLWMRCSKGTYVRTLVDDLGQQLGCGAYVTALRRLAAGLFDATQMVTFEVLEQIDLSMRHRSLLPVDAMVEHLPRLNMSEEQQLALYQGKQLDIEALAVQEPGLYRLYHQNHFMGIGRYEGEVLAPQRLLCRLN